MSFAIMFQGHVISDETSISTFNVANDDHFRTRVLGRGGAKSSWAQMCKAAKEHEATDQPGSSKENRTRNTSAKPVKLKRSLWESTVDQQGMLLEPGQVCVQDVPSVETIHAAQVVDNACGVANMTRETFKTKASVRSTSYLGVILPGQVNKGMAELGITDSAIILFTAFMKDPIKSCVEKRQ
eukprot:3856275-Karenia_brevis.AAC.1